jgi:phosphoinositide-3-kinase regulatory subunit 4
MCSTQEEG